MAEPLFTIITPTWQQAEFIGDTIDSVLCQSLGDFEYIIVDNCSDDGTEEIVRGYCEKDKRIIYIREKDHGQAEAINKGLKRAAGKYVAWINSDDCYKDEHVLEKVAAAFEKKPESTLVIGDAWYCDREKRLTEYNASFRKGYDGMIRRWYYIVQPAAFWRNKGRLLDEKYHYVFDWKFFTGLFDEGTPCYIRKPLALYRMYGDNKTGQNNAKRKFEIYRLQKELGDSRLNIEWCRFIYKAYKKAEDRGDDKRKEMLDLLCRIVFHLSGRRLVCF
ncbi:MAG: glycosyltransferase [Lachnospiraceae bacterium]|nr:glycosyltransferase [Lachnospiraceae bacterium]